MKAMFPCLALSRAARSAILPLLLTAGLANVSLAQGGAGDAEDEIYELSPFTIVSDDADGYRASNTLAGSRLKTPLRDVGSSISVLTDQFFTDTGATDAATALSYAVGMEVSGEQGNFSNGSIGSGNNNSVNLRTMRESPQTSQRVRGLARAELTRDFFLTDIPFDQYNTGLVTIQRGPNSLLFGIGSPGGIIDNALNQATEGRDFGEVSLRVGEKSSYRLSLDVNKVLVEDRLALRVAALDEETNYRQEPAFEDDRRLYLAFKSILFPGKGDGFWGQTTARGSFETGEIDRNPPAIIPPGDAIKDWFELPNPEIQQISDIDWATASGGSVSWAVDGSFQPKWVVDNNRPEGFPRAWRTIDGSARPTFFLAPGVMFQPGGAAGVGFPDAPEIQGMQSRIPYKDGEQGRSGSNPRGELFLSKTFEAETFSTGFAMPVIQNRNTFDNMTRLLTGNTNSVVEDFDAYNLTFEQLLLNGNAGIEVAYDKQEYDRNSALSFLQGRWGSIAIDVNGYMTYEDRPNPNVGRPVVFTNEIGNSRQQLTDREALRATAFYRLDFAERGEKAGWWLGRHVLSAFYNDQEIHETERWRSGKYIAKDFDWAAINDNPINHFNHNVAIWQYLGPSYLNDASAQSPEDVRVEHVLNLPEFREGQDYTIAYWDNFVNEWTTGTITTTRILDFGTRTEDAFESSIFSVLSYLLGGNLVALAGWRTDSIENFSQTSDRLADGNVEDPAGIELEALPAIDDVKSNTWSLVGHLPFDLPGKSKLSLHYNESENFQPTTVRRNAFGAPISSPQGSTEEYGLSLSMFEGKAHLRANWYETESSGNEVAVGSAIRGSIMTVVDALNEWQETADRNSDGLPDNDISIDQALSPLSEGGLQDSGLDASGRFSSFDDLLQTILGTIPDDVQERAKVARDATGTWSITGDFGNRVATQDQSAEGFELEFVVSPSGGNWRLGANVARQETITANTAASLGQLVDQIDGNFRSANIADLRDRPVSTTGFVFESTYFRSAFLPTANARAKDGTVAQELREWRANAFGHYSFTDSFLKGFGIGGALRWQDSVATGYRLKFDENDVLVSDTSQPFFGPDELAGDLWITYERNLGDRIDWRVQLNIRNLIGEDSYIPVGHNPDGSLAIVRNPNPRVLFLTNTFSF